MPGSGSGWGTTAGSRDTVTLASRLVSSSAWRSKLMPVALTWMRALTESTPSGTSELRSTFSADTLKSGALYVPEPSRSTLVRPATSMCRWLMGAAAAA